MSEDGDGSEGGAELLLPASGCASPTCQEVEYELKFETGMYKVREDEYVIDVQVGSGASTPGTLRAVWGGLLLGSCFGRGRGGGGGGQLDCCTCGTAALRMPAVVQRCCPPRCKAARGCC
jgi:hypothetical protein